MSLFSGLNRSVGIIKCLPLNKINFGRLISTSGKKREASALIDTKSKTESEYVPDDKNWVSYGFAQHDETADLNYMHLFSFFAVSIAMVGTGFVLAYRPFGHTDKDWFHREAYLELRRREKLGLPPVDANYLNPDKIKLPTDEELGETEIII